MDHPQQKEIEYLELRTRRNRNLITKEEQDIYYNAKIGIFGMSVGSHAAIVIAMTGGGKYMRLADPDMLEGSNLNRIRTGFQNIGFPKVEIVTRQIYEINPYADIDTHPEGVTDDNIEKIMSGPPKLDLLVEEMDNPYFKFKAREYCKRYRIPLISAADNGDGAIAHIERYDTDKNQKYFNGIMGDLTAENVKHLDRKRLISVIAKTVGAERSVPRMQKSVLEVGKTLESWPQLGTAANLCGTVLAYLARRIILKSKNIRSGIYDISMDAIFESDYNTKKELERRKRNTAKFLKRLGI